MHFLPDKGMDLKYAGRTFDTSTLQKRPLQQDFERKLLKLEYSGLLLLHGVI